jgi:hypothetical protein
MGQSCRPTGGFCRLPYAVTEVGTIVRLVSDDRRFYRDVLGMELLCGAEDTGFSSLRARDAHSAILNLERGEVRCGKFWKMRAAVLASNFYSALAIAVLFLHALFILWVVFGALLTRSRPILRWLHIASLVWGILTELLPWPCPLTVLENWLEGKAGIEPYQGGFLLHYLDRLVYPDISAAVLTVAGVIICALNLAVYGRRIWIARRR